jgi:site-specific recombinase XerD
MVSGVRKPESGAMERLRDRMTQELRIRGMAELTVEAYVHAMRLLTERTGLLPGHVTEPDLKAYLESLREVRRVAGSTYAQHVAAMRFFYTHLTDGSMGRVHEALSTMTGGL